MNTKTNKSVFLSVFALALMVGSGLLLGWTINTLSRSIESGGVFILVLVSVFLYIAGTVWMGRIVTQTGRYWKHGGFHNGIIFALLATGVGVLLLCLNRGIFTSPPEWKSFFISWPMLLFVFGGIELCKAHYMRGTIMAAIGTFFIIPRFAEITRTSFDEQFLSTWWPIFIIIGGLLIFFSILIKPTCLRRRQSNPKGLWTDNYIPNQEENQDGKINYKFMFSGAEQVILDPVFKGGYIEAVFGGLELDLRRTSLSEGETFLHVKTVFGGAEIKAPEDWYIDIRSESFAGGVSDDRPKSQNIGHSKKLIIVAKCTFGGITIS